MNKKLGGFNYISSSDSIINQILGVFVIVDFDKEQITLLGNNADILGINNNALNFSFEKFKKFIDEKYINDLENFVISEDYKVNQFIFELIDNNGKRKKLIIQGKANKNYEDYLYFEGYAFEINNNDLNYRCTQVLDKEISDKLTYKNIVKKQVEDSLLAVEKDKSALMILDIDNFNYINDSFGYLYGNLFLEKIVKEIKILLNKNDIIYKIDGDRFLIFLSRIGTVKEIESAAKALLNLINKPYRIFNEDIYTTASIGVAILGDDGKSFNDIVKNADIALYIAKGNGKNQYQFYNKSISNEMNRVYSIQKRLTTAVEKGEMYVVFQPKISLDNEGVNGFEALLRWNNTELGNVSPSDFIPIAEASGMIIPIGKFVLREVFHKAKCLLDNGYDNFKIAFNISQVQLKDEDLVSEFEKISKELNIPGKYIEVEITESILIKSFDKNISYLYRFKEMGATIALDDFGTGYSSLNYLTKLPIDSLKIDRSFLVDILHNHKNRWVVENIIELSHKLGIEVVAEGVEEKEQVDYLRGILCDTVQGYYYSKPEAFETVIKLLDK